MARSESQRLFTLNFHGLGEPGRDLPPGEADCWIDAKFFADILDAVAGRPDVRITFDDSNESDYTIALPLLKARGLKAKFFLVAQRIDEKFYLSKQQIQALLAAGMEVGNHGMQHRRWRGLDERGLREELVESREILQQATGAALKAAACPFGEYDRRVLGMLRESGYETVYTSDGGPAWSNQWVQPRNTVRRSHDLDAVSRACRQIPAGAGGLARDFKLLLKRWR